MRRTYHAQLPLMSANAHPRAAELCEMSAVLDANVGVLRRVHADLLRQRKADAKRGREGMTAEQVVRAALVKQMFGSSYEELAFQLGDSLVLRGFCRLSPSSASPKRSGLQANIASIRPETWEAMNKGPSRPSGNNPVAVSLSGDVRAQRSPPGQGDARTTALSASGDVRAHRSEFVTCGAGRCLLVPALGLLGDHWPSRLTDR